MLYEAAWPQIIGKEALAQELRTTELWPPIVGDAEASLRDLRAIEPLPGQAHEGARSFEGGFQAAGSPAGAIRLDERGWQPPVDSGG